MRDKRRWIEWGKNVVIALLTLSAVWLLSMTPLVRDSGVLDLLPPRESPGAGAVTGGAAAAMLPARMVITGEGGHCGIQYDETRLEEQFPPLGALLGDALASAGQPQPLEESRWRRLLEGRGVYFDFLGDVPLAALEHWLQGPGEGTLEGSARRVLLCAGEGDQVLLCWQDAEGGRFFSSPTALTQALHLDPATAGAAPNGACFAFESPQLKDRLSPYTLITVGGETGGCYAASLPLAGEGQRDTVLEALSFAGQNPAPVNGGEVYPDGGDRLVVYDNGTVAFRAAQGEKYPVGAGRAAGVDGARVLAERTLGALCGEARLYLMSAKDTENGLRVRFGYLLDGSAVYLGGEGWAAEFWVRDGYIVQFTLRFRSYAANGEQALLLPIDKAAAMLPEYTPEQRELVIQYRDGGGPEVRPDWVAA